MTSSTVPGAVDRKVHEVFGRSRVVLIDDVPGNVALLRQLLNLAGATQVHAFTDPREAVAQIPDLDPDLVLLDLHMPGMDGFEVLAALQQVLPADTFLPVLVLTADVTRETRRRALSLGAKDFLTKPIDTDETLLRARNLLETCALHKQLKSRNAELHRQLEQAMAAERAAHEERQRTLALVRRVLAEGGPSMLFQPVVDLRRGDCVGVEALARFAPQPYEGTEAWFAAADRVSLGVELELAAIRAGTSQLSELPPGGFLSVNASVRTACSLDLDAHLRTLPLDRVVLELTEHAQVTDFSELNDALARHREAGMRVAIDDTGAGYASFQHLLQLQPDIIKLDIALTRDIDSDPARRSLALALTAFASEVGADVIAEGIETEGELQVLRDLEVPWGQGYHLGRPGPLPVVS